MKRIIISDIHIGSRYYRCEELIDFLQKIEYDQLILAGDIIDLIKVPQFNSRVLEIVKAIDFSKEIIYIVGNHDTSLSGFIGEEIFGVKFVKDYSFKELNKIFWIEHGDRFDQSWFVHNKIIMKFLSVAQDCIEHWFDVNFNDWITDWKIKHRKLKRIWDILEDNPEIDVFICGHFHTPESVTWTQSNQITKTYVNAGSWVGPIPTYVEITDGDIKLREWKIE